MVNSVLMKKELTCERIEELEHVAREIADFALDHKIWLFEGDMGAGKTTLIKAICKTFNVEDVVNSPTFSIVNEYVDNQNNTYYHFDFYRLKDEEEAIHIGAEEYFDSGNYCFIEWPSKVDGILPDETLIIRINALGKEKRHFELIRNE